MLKGLAATLIVLAVAGCTTEEFLHGLGQTVYNSGKYVCKQSPGHCDADDGLPPGAAPGGR